MDDQHSDDEHSQTAPGSGNGSTPTGDEGSHPEADGPAQGSFTGPIYSLRVKLVVVAVVLVSVGAVTWIYLRTVNSDNGSRPAADQVAPGVESFRPGRGAQVQDQSAVEVELTPGWDGTLTIDGVQIPESDLTRERQASPDPQPGGQDRPTMVEDRLEFVPGAGKVLEQLPSGETCVTADLHHRADPNQRRTFDWCFTVF